MSLPDDMIDAALEQDELSHARHEDILTDDQSIALSLIDSIESDRPYYFSSLPGETWEQKKKRMSYVNSGDNDIDDIIRPKKFDVVNVILTKTSFTNEDGKRVSGPKCILINGKGESKVIMSKVWVKQFLSLFVELGLPPWDKGICVGASEVKMKGGRRYYKLELP